MAVIGDVGAGNTLGRYELLTPIAQGGMAMVWAARLKGTRGFQKIVAIKTMLPALSDDPQFEQMFLAEAELTARIRHPNVCEIMDLGEEDATLYIVMEWVNGEPLTSLMKAAHGHIPLPIVTKLARDAALGLHAAHEVKNEEGELVGLVHRDVSPHNILIGQDGIVKVVDFGIAKATTAVDNSKTQAGQVKGKIPYMAPEQARGGKVDRRTDIFAHGVVLYQLITGKHPFRGDDDIQTLRKICERLPAPRPSALVPVVPPSLDAVVAKALEKDPLRRFQTMAEFAEALDKVRAEFAAKGEDKDVGDFVRGILGGRAEKRKHAIKEGIRVADERRQTKTQVGHAPLADVGDGAKSGPSSSSSGSSQLATDPAFAAESGSSSNISGVSQVSLVGFPGGPITGITGTALPSGDTSRSPSSQAGVTTASIADPSMPAPPTRRFSTLVVGLVAVVAGVVALVAIVRPGGEPSAVEGAAKARTDPAPASSAVPEAVVSEPGALAKTPSEPIGTAEIAHVNTSEATDATAPSAGSSSGKPPSKPNQGPRRGVPAVGPTAVPAVTATAPPTSGMKVRDPGF